MISVNATERVFMISCNREAASGTAFAVDVDGRQYLLTTKQAVAGLGDRIYLFSKAGWRELGATLVGHSETSDLSVLAVDRKLTPASRRPLELFSRGLIYGQDLYFLGFPYGVTGPYRFGEDGYPLPHVKKAIVSYVVSDTVFLDGHYNPGFSGGPVIFVDQSKPPAVPPEYKVAAVVSDYRGDEGDAYGGDDESDVEVRYLYNAGMMCCPMADVALILIAANPVGYRL